MGLGTLRERQLIRSCGRIFRLDALLPTGQWCMTDLASGLVDQKSSHELWQAYESGALAFISTTTDAAERTQREISQQYSEAASIGPASPVEQDADGTVGAHRATYVLAVRGKGKQESIRVIQECWIRLGWPAWPPGYSSVMRWRKIADGCPNPALALRAGDHRKGRRGHRYTPEIINIMREVRDSHYLASNPRITIAKAVEIVSDKVVLKNAARPQADRLPTPGRKAFLAVVKELDHEEVIAARFGRDKAIAMLRTSLGGVKVTNPLERVEIDHTVLSIILLDDDFEPLGRAFITVAKDACTRSVVGYYWGAENPSTVSLARCLKHSMLPKIDFLSRFTGVKNSWPCFGVAETWVIDNGLEEHAAALQQAAAEAGVQKIEFCARARPWQKPNIERFFRTQDQSLLHGLPGTTMENIAKRSDFDPKKDMLIRWSAFGKILAQWVVDVYMQTPQKILKQRSPCQAWEAHAGTFLPFVPERTTILECLFLRQIDGRVLDHEGIEFDCLIYNSLDMRVMRSKLGAKLKVSIRVNDEDVSFIYVHVPKTEVWVRVPALDFSYAEGMTRWQHARCKKMRKVCQDEGLQLSLAEAREQIREDVAAEITTVKQGRKKARERMREKGPRPSGQRAISVIETSARPVDDSMVVSERSDEGHISTLECDVFERTW